MKNRIIQKIAIMTGLLTDSTLMLKKGQLFWKKFIKLSQQQKMRECMF